MSALATAGAGFLLAVLWMDLMFDVQVLRHRSGGRELPEPVLASIAAYYRRVTTDASPMGRAIGVVMIATAGSLLGELLLGGRPVWLNLASLAIRLGTWGAQLTPAETRLLAGIIGWAEPVILLAILLMLWLAGSPLWWVGTHLVAKRGDELRM